jgi:pimeloyl-ACP methyl ester carboxylesterase
MASGQQVFIGGTVTRNTPGPAWQTAAWLTVPDVLPRSELQILIHGAGYDHRYWDCPVEPDRYSYVEWAAARGIATLSIDRIGAGASSKPASDLNTIEAQAEILSQIVAQARSGLAGTAPFSRVVLVGHSLGSVIAGCEAATYNDADAVVLTGYVPVDGRPDGGEALIAMGFVPATEGLPHLLGLVDDGYLTPRLDVRGRLLFWPPRTDPAMISTDALLVSTVTRTELLGAAAAGRTIRSASAPTLVLVGQHDVLLSSPAAGQDCYDTVRDVAAYSPAHFDFEVVPDCGHNLTLHLNAHASHEVLNRWLDARADRPVAAE